MINDNPKPNKVDMGGIRKKPASLEGLNLSVIFLSLLISLLINFYL